MAVEVLERRVSCRPVGVRCYRHGCGPASRRRGWHRRRRTPRRPRVAGTPRTARLISREPRERTVSMPAGGHEPCRSLRSPAAAQDAPEHRRTKAHEAPHRWRRLMESSTPSTRGSANWLDWEAARARGGGSAPWVRHAGWQGAARDSTVGLFGRQAPCPLVNGSRWKARFDPVFRMAAVTEPGPVRWIQAMA
jgi:hypothetical protein